MKSRNRGFTLLELLMVIAMIALIAAIAVPNFRPAWTSTQMKQASRQLQADLILARQEAIGENTTSAVYLYVSSYDIRVVNTTERKKLPGSISFAAASQNRTINFDNTGNPGAADITLNLTARSNIPSSVIVRAVTGRVEVIDH
ncbi:MAG: Tfp pilus assembly protein FimT/FimU [Acidobacteriota bacterium]